MRFVGRTLCLICLLLAAACGSPSLKLQAQAEQLNLQSLELLGGTYRLAAFYRPGWSGEHTLHVYLEGDGRPWQQGRWPAADPTTRSSLMLPLLGLDSRPALYLGRPCYNGHEADPGCDATLWTSARYGETVVEAMAAALRQFCSSRGFRQLVLIGHSGGGSLAMLLASRLSQTVLVVTLAGNYDIDSWTEYHHYLPLSGSLNPARQPEPGVPEWHFLAELDQTVPPGLFLAALKRRTHGHVEILPAISHHDGWLEAWPRILNSIAEKH